MTVMNVRYNDINKNREAGQDGQVSPLFEPQAWNRVLYTSLF